MFGNCYAPHVENNYEFALRMCVVKFLNYLKVVYNTDEFINAPGS